MNSPARKITAVTGPAAPVAQQLLQMGLEGADQEEVLGGYCRALVDLGVPLMRLHVAQSAFHPRYGGVGFDWTRTSGITYEQYEFTDTPREVWLQSPLYYLLETSEMELRVRLKDANEPSRFPLLNELRETGHTD